MTKTEVSLHPGDILLNILAALLAPLFISASNGDIAFARMAAIETINAYRGRNPADLIAVSQIIAFGLTALGSLSRSMADAISLSMMLRLRGNATALHRAAEQNRRSMREHHAPTATRRPATPAQPEPAIQPAPEQRPPAVQPYDIRSDVATITTTVANEAAVSAPARPSDERQLPGSSATPAEEPLSRRPVSSPPQVSSQRAANPAPAARPQAASQEQVNPAPASPTSASPTSAPKVSNQAAPHPAPATPPRTFSQKPANPAPVQAAPRKAQAGAKPFNPRQNPANTLDPRPRSCENPPETRGTEVPPTKTLTEGQRAYEAKRAAKAGMSLDKWLSSKQREREAEEKAKLKAVEATKPPKPPGFFGRLLERAQKPLGS
jgi:hypothetical protein